MHAQVAGGERSITGLCFLSSSTVQSLRLTDLPSWLGFAGKLGDVTVGFADLWLQLPSRLHANPVWCYVMGC